MALLAKHLDSLDLVEQRVREPVDLRVSGVSAGEDPEIDDDAWPLVLFLDEYECWIGHAPLIPSRGSQRNMRSARSSPARPQAANAARASGEPASPSPSTNVARMSRSRCVSGRTSATASRKPGSSLVGKNAPEMNAI